MKKLTLSLGILLISGSAFAQKITSSGVTLGARAIPGKRSNTKAPPKIVGVVGTPEAVLKAETGNLYPNAQAALSEGLVDDNSVDNYFVMQVDHIKNFLSPEDFKKFEAWQKDNANKKLYFRVIPDANGAPRLAPVYTDCDSGLAEATIDGERSIWSMVLECLNGIKSVNRSQVFEAIFFGGHGAAQ